MIVPRPSGQLPIQESANVRAERSPGPRTAKRLATFRDDVRYVKAGGWAQFLAWLVDFVMIVIVIDVGVDTQLLHFADGGRIGGKAPWTMLIRTIRHHMTRKRCAILPDSLTSTSLVDGGRSLPRGMTMGRSRFTRGLAGFNGTPSIGDLREHYGITPG